MTQSNEGVPVEVSLARRLRFRGWTLQEIADHEEIDHGIAWVRKVTVEEEE